MELWGKVGWVGRESVPPGLNRLRKKVPWKRRLSRDEGAQRSPHGREYGEGNVGQNSLTEEERADPRRSISQRKRKLIERVFGWSKLDRPLRQVKLRGLDRVDWFYRRTIAAYHLVRMRSLILIQPTAAEARTVSGDRQKPDSRHKTTTEISPQKRQFHEKLNRLDLTNEQTPVFPQPVKPVPFTLKPVPE